MGADRFDQDETAPVTHRRNIRSPHHHALTCWTIKKAHCLGELCAKQLQHAWWLGLLGFKNSRVPLLPKIPNCVHDHHCLSSSLILYHILQ